MRIEVVTSSFGIVNTRTSSCCILAITVSWRGLVRIVIVSSFNGLSSVVVILRRLFVSGRFRLMVFLVFGSIISFFIYIFGVLRK